MPRIPRSRRLVIPQGATADVPATLLPLASADDGSPLGTPATFPREQLFHVPGRLLFWLGNSISTLRCAAAHELVGRDWPCDGVTCEDFLRDEWRALGADGPGYVAWLDHAMRTERSLLAIEMIAMALGVQGEDGLATLLDLLEHRASDRAAPVARAGWARGHVASRLADADRRRQGGAHRRDAAIRAARPLSALRR